MGENLVKVERPLCLHGAPLPTLFTTRPATPRHASTHHTPCTRARSLCADTPWGTNHPRQLAAENGQRRCDDIEYDPSRQAPGVSRKSAVAVNVKESGAHDIIIIYSYALLKPGQLQPFTVYIWRKCIIRSQQHCRVVERSCPLCCCVAVLCSYARSPMLFNTETKAFGSMLGGWAL